MVIGLPAPESRTRLNKRHQTENEGKNRLRLLVNPNRTNIEVSVGERPGVLIHQVRARALASVLAVARSRPIPTERQVDDDVVPPELLIDVALRVGEERRRRALSRNVNVSESGSRHRGLRTTDLPKRRC